MICQGQYLNPGRMGTGHQVGRAQGAVRANTVGMKVNNGHGVMVWV